MSLFFLVDPPISSATLWVASAGPLIVGCLKIVHCSGEVIMYAKPKYEGGKRTSPFLPKASCSVYTLNSGSTAIGPHLRLDSTMRILNYPNAVCTGPDPLLWSSSVRRPYFVKRVGHRGLNSFGIPQASRSVSTEPTYPSTSVCGGSYSWWWSASRIPLSARSVSWYAFCRGECER